MEKAQGFGSAAEQVAAVVAQPKVLVTGVVLAAMALSACGSGTSSAKSGDHDRHDRGDTHRSTRRSATGVTADSIKLGVALVDFKEIEQYTDTIRTKAEQKQIYEAFIKDINDKGGIAGRKIVPVYKYYCPARHAPDPHRSCTSFAQDDNVFAVVGTFIDFSGDAQTCVAKQEKRVLMTFDLTQAIIDKSPPGLIVTPGHHPRAVGVDILLALAEEGEDARRARPSRCSATRT